MNRIIKRSSPTALLCLMAGTAIAQPTISHVQGTITRQRPLLSSYNSTGWLSNHTTPRFWFWSQTAGTAFPPGHTETKRWVHGFAPYDKSDPYNKPRLFDDNTGLPNVVTIENLAHLIVEKARILVESGHITSSEDFAIFIQHWGFSSNLYRNQNDELSNVFHDGNIIYLRQWDVHASKPFYTSGNSATPWRSNGVSDSQAVFIALVDKITAKITEYNDTHTYTIPPPSRLFFDDENGYFRGSSFDIIAVYDSMINDPRSDILTGETLYGDFTNWTTSTDPKASEILSNFNPSYSPMNAYPYWPPSSSDQHQFSDYNTHRSLLTAVADGALKSAIGPILDAVWPDALWSNYITSGWYSHNYPRFSRGDNGAPIPQCPDVFNTPLFGWAAIAANGSSDMQSPALYPVHDSQSHEYDQTNCDGTISTSTRFRTALSHSRMQLDHAIFSFDQSDMSVNTPHHITPWIMRAKTNTSLPGTSAHILKSHARDVLALAKSKGVNEAILWGKAENSLQSQWTATNDAISQVWDYNLGRFRVQVPGPMTTLSGDDLEATKFSEEHTYDIQPVLNSNSTQYNVVMLLDFDLSSTLTELGQEYTFILESLDGGGPWHGVVPEVRIRNYQNGFSYEPINGTHETLNSISTRRVEFSEDTGDSLYDSWQLHFDDEADVNDVIDRKTIHKFVFTLPSDPVDRDDYLDPANNRVTLRLVFHHNILPPSGFPADPLRIDLVQLYESEEANNNIAAAPQPLLGDLNNDMSIDATDMMQYMQDYASNPSLKLDLNNDGQVDLSDVDIMNELVNKK